MERSRNDPASPEELALEMYAALLDGRDLGAPLAALAAALGATSQIMQVMQFQGPQSVAATEVATTFGLDPGMVKEYAEHWVRHDPWAKAAPSHIPQALALHRVLPAADFSRTEYWNDFARRWDGPLHGLAVDVGGEGEKRGVFCAHRPRSREPFGPQEEALLNRLVPHLRRVLAAQASMVRAGTQAAAVAGMDALRQGVALIDAGGKLVGANAALHRMVALNDGISLTRKGLRCDDRPVQGALDIAVQAALAGLEGRVRLLPAAASLALRRPSGAMPWLVHVLPVRPGNGGQGMLATLGGNFSGAMLLVTDAEARPRAPSRVLLEKALGLSPAEAALAAALGQGISPAAHAKTRGVSVETVRTHLAALRRKTGCRRQAEIGLLVARLING